MFACVLVPSACGLVHNHSANYGAWLVTCDPQDWEGMGISVDCNTLTCDAKCDKRTKEHSIRYLTPMDASSPEFEVLCFQDPCIAKGPRTSK